MYKLNITTYVYVFAFPKSNQLRLTFFSVLLFTQKYIFNVWLFFVLNGNIEISHWNSKTSHVCDMHFHLLFNVFLLKGIKV